MGTLDDLTSKDLQIQQVEFDDGDSSPKTVWDPPGTNRVRVHNVMAAVINKTANSNCTIRVELNRKGTWKEIAVIGAQNKEYDHMNIDFKGLIRGQEIRVSKAGTASTWSAWVMVTGEVVE